MTITRVGITEFRLRRAVASSGVVRDVRQRDADSASKTLTLTERSDIIVVILDANAGDSLLSAEYALQHRQLRDSLAQLGVRFGPDGFRSNYTRTFASVASALNFTNLADVASESLVSVQHPGDFHSIIQIRAPLESSVLPGMKSIGFRHRSSPVVRSSQVGPEFTARAGARLAGERCRACSSPRGLSRCSCRPL